VPPPAEISEEEIDKHARSRVLIKLLRLREQYRKVFKDDYEYVLQQAAEAVREFAASNREAYTTGRNAILEIGGYQAWDGVLRHPYYSDELYDRTSIFAIICIVAGSIGFAIDYSVTGHGIWWVILLALIVIGASFALCLVAYLVMQRTDYLPKRWRKLCNFAALLILTVVLWPLWHWTGFWGYALFAGGAVATGILIAVGIAIQMSELIVAIMFRRSWMRHTTGEIIETLAAVRAALSKPPCLMRAIRYGRQANLTMPLHVLSAICLVTSQARDSISWAQSSSDALRWPPQCATWLPTACWQGLIPGTRSAAKYLC
jgi:hypothetical protein